MSHIFHHHVSYSLIFGKFKDHGFPMDSLKKTTETCTNSPGAGRIQGVHHGGGQVEAAIATPGGVKGMEK